MEVTLKEKVYQIIKDVADMDVDVQDETTLYQLDLDDLERIDLAANLEEKLNVKLANNCEDNWNTALDVYNEVAFNREPTDRFCQKCKTILCDGEYKFCFECKDT